MEKGKYQLDINYDMDSILSMAECSKEDPNYGVYKERLQVLLDQHLPKLQPEGYAVYGQHLGKSVVYCITTLGPYLDGQVAKAFETYEYLDGMMLSAMGDSILFEASGHLHRRLRNEVTAAGRYLSARIEPGSSKADMTMQKTIYDHVAPAFDLGMTITEGYMLSPSKSMAYYYEITEDDCSLGMDHDCSSCDSVNCKQRHFNMKIHRGPNVELIQARRGDNLLEVLRKHHVFVDAPCSGMGSCGKCKITARNHGYELSEKEVGYLTPGEEAANVILACYHEVDRDLEIFLADDSQEGHEIEAGYAAFEVKDARYDPEAYMKAHHPIGIGVDIGTTTLAVSLVNLVTHQVLDISKRINPQKAYGADIISRIMYVGEHHDQMLSDLICRAIEEMSEQLIEAQGYNPEHIEQMVISGNTTMIYLLLNMDPAPLAVAPFVTEDIPMVTLPSDRLFKAMGNFDVVLSPWISAYVGGDIVSGLFATHMLDKNDNIVFIDIGTNGEMVLKTKDRMISAATAAGPAFEGANIKCGMGSVSGAICEIKADEEGYDVVTLGDEPPAGICGSALIDAVALLHRQGYVDDMGFMAEAVMFHGEIGLYPEDIRQVQLAKAAIMAGVDVLLDQAELTYEDIDALYIAGGFGSHMNIENSAYIGLIPKEIIDRVTVVGNTSLAGSVRYLLEKDGAGEIEAIRTGCEYVELSTNLKFNEAYVMGMTFGDLRL